MIPTVKIDFVSDVSCPWCAVGLWGLEQALSRLQGELQASWHVRPFLLNPHMPAGGQNFAEHIMQKYGSTTEQQAQLCETLRQRGADVGFVFRFPAEARIYNTFDTHRLLHWAGEAYPERQLALKKALLVACHRDREDMESHAVLLQIVQEIGLDVARARALLASDAYAQAVREEAAQYAGLGIHSVPAAIINDRHLLSGGQPVAVFEQALRKLANLPQTA